MKSSKFTTGISTLGILLCILDTDTIITACREGIALCLYTVLPSLFPFCVFSNLLSRSVQPMPLFRPLGQAFQLPEGSETILLIGCLGGYPMGALSVHNAWTSGGISRENANRMLTFCSQPGPAFLFGVLGSTFASVQCWLLWAVLLLSAWITSALFPPDTSISGNTSSIFPKSGKPLIASAVASMANVCAWILLMRILIGFLDRWILWMLPDSVRCLLCGILELTNGCTMIKNLSLFPIRFILASCMLSFGGLCVLMQTKSLISGLDIRYYARGKLIQTFCCLCLSCAICGYWWMVLPLFLLFLPYKSRKNSSFPLRHGV